MCMVGMIFYFQQSFECAWIVGLETVISQICRLEVFPLANTGDMANGKIEKSLGPWRFHWPPSQPAL